MHQLRRLGGLRPTSIQQRFTPCTTVIENKDCSCQLLVQHSIVTKHGALRNDPSSNGNADGWHRMFKSEPLRLLSCRKLWWMNVFWRLEKDGMQHWWTRVRMWLRVWLRMWLREEFKAASSSLTLYLTLNHWYFWNKFLFSSRTSLMLHGISKIRNRNPNPTLPCISLFPTPSKCQLLLWF